MPPTITADTNLVSLRAIREATYGTTPSNPAMQRLRLRGVDMRPNKQTEVDPSLRADRMIDSLVRVLVGATCSIPFSFAYGADFELFLEGLMGATIVSKKSAGTFTIDKTGAPVGKAYVKRAAGDFTTDFPTDCVGAFARLHGFEPAASNAAFKVDAIAAGQITLDDPNALITNDAVGEGNEQVDIRYVRNGTTRYGFSIEEAVTHSDGSVSYALGKGMVVAGMRFRVQEATIIDAEWRFEGLDVTPSGAAIAGETLVATPTTQPMSASGEVTNTRLSGVDTSVLQSAEINVETGARRKTAVGSLVPIDIGLGRFNPSGSIRSHFDSYQQMLAFKNHTANRIDLLLKDLSGNIVVLTIPQYRYGEGGKPVQGVDQDISFEGNFQAERDATLSAAGAMMQVCLLPATPLT
jgi:hypothetical protein